MKSALLAVGFAAMMFGVGGASAESHFTYISPSIILLGEPAPEENSDTAEADEDEPMPRVITGATEAEQEDAADSAGVAADEETGAIVEPFETGQAPRSTVPPPEDTDPLRGPIIPAPPANTAE